MKRMKSEEVGLLGSGLRFFGGKIRYYGKSATGLVAGALADYTIYNVFGVTPHVVRRIGAVGI